MSFNFGGYYRVGSYRVLRTFAMNQLRSARQRVKTINAELERIGNVSITWKQTSSDDEPNRVSEERIGLSVPPHTSLGRLVQAYIALGGNPFDISMFLDPSTSDWRTLPPAEGSLVIENQYNPYGGVLYPLSRFAKDYGRGGLGSLDSGGMLTGSKNPKRRLGEAPVNNRPNYATTRRHQSLLRKPYLQAIRDKRNNLEWRILKLMDLKEQLEEERTWILAAAGGFVTGMPIPPCAIGYTVSTSDLIQSLDNEIYSYEEGINAGVDRNKIGEGVRSYIYQDFVQEKWTGL